jgi:hypothetical protein
MVCQMAWSTHSHRQTLASVIRCLSPVSGRYNRVGFMDNALPFHMSYIFVLAESDNLRLIDPV